MKKVLSFILLVTVFFTGIFPVSALSVRLAENSNDSPTSKEIEYPTGAEFVRLKELIDTTFSKPTYQGRYGCIASSTLCPNYKYTSITEKAIKFIVLKTYTGNEEFYKTLFSSTSYYSNPAGTLDIKTLLDRIPKGATVPDWKNLSFGNSIGGDLLDASFGVDFTENSTTNGMIGAIEQKIKELKRRKCEEKNRGNYSTRMNTNDCYSNTLSNIYLPTQEELYAETIYLNRGSVKIESLKNEFDYTITFSEKNTENLNLRTVTDTALEKVLAIKAGYTPKAFTGTSSMSISIGDGSSDYEDNEYLKTIPLKLTLTDDEIPKVDIHGIGIKNKNKPGVWLDPFQDADLDIKGMRRTYKMNDFIYIQSHLDYLNRLIAKHKRKDMKVIQDFSLLSDAIIAEASYIISNLENVLNYTLRYRKDVYTLAEALNEISGKNTILPEKIIFSNANENLDILDGFLSSSERKLLTADYFNMRSVLQIYYADNNGFYPRSLDDQKLIEIFSDKKIPDIITKYFTYSLDANGNYQFEYIGPRKPIPQNSSSPKKDYLALMSGATVPEIPAIFSHVPSDSMALYIRNPEHLLDILNQKSNTSTRLSGLDVSESIRKFMMTFFELENFDQIQKHLKHDMVVAVNNLDATAPDIVVILSEADKDALSPTAQARVVGSKDGFIFIASSKKSIERFTGLSVETSMKNAPDFHYVWWKKSQKIRDAFVFVGDAFFEKMLTFESYIEHYRKYRDYARLSSLQELVWAYSDAFGAVPNSLGELGNIGLTSLIGASLSEYSISDGGIVVHKNIGSLKSIKTLPESHYSMDQISRTEIEDYKTNILKYRDIWRASLDPMGIVLNRYGDGMEIDFFMTPIPFFDDRDLREARQIFEGLGKSELSFFKNPRIRTGLISLVWGIDIKKIQEKFSNQSELVVKELQSGMNEINRELLDGKNILDYLAGEFALSFGSIDSDILDGWNVEKVDIYGSVQVTSEEKGKELIDMIRTKILKEFDRSSGDEAEMVRGFLAKPLIEDYKNKKIFYVEGLPIPFVGKIGFAYTFVDDFFIIGLNRSTIRRIIDTATTTDLRKKEIVDKESFSTGTFFTVFFDGIESTKQFQGLYEKNKTSIPRYMRYLGMADMKNDTTFRSIFGAYYVTQERNKRLSLPIKPLSYELGALSLIGDTENISIRLDEKKLNTLSGATLQTWENLKSDTGFPKQLLTSTGIYVAELLQYKNIGDILSLAIVSHLDAAFEGKDSLFRNTIFGLNIGDNEIGFNLKIFRNKDVKNLSKGISISNESFILIVLGIVFATALVGGGILFFRRKNTPESNNLFENGFKPSVNVQNPEMPIPSTSPTSIPSTSTISYPSEGPIPSENTPHP